MASLAEQTNRSNPLYCFLISPSNNPQSTNCPQDHILQSMVSKKQFEEF